MKLCQMDSFNFIRKPLHFTKSEKLFKPLNKNTLTTSLYVLFKSNVDFILLSFVFLSAAK